MAHHHIIKTLLIINLVILLSQAEENIKNELKLPLPTARAINSESDLQSEGVSNNGRYHFRYIVNNHENGDFKTQEETREGKTVHGRYTVAEPTGHIREVKYTADEKNGFRADIKMHPPGSFENKNSEKRSADASRGKERFAAHHRPADIQIEKLSRSEAEDKIDSEEKVEEVQNDKASDEQMEEPQSAETKTSEEVPNDTPQVPEEMTDEEIEKTLEKQEHILDPQNHEPSNNDELKSASQASHEDADNLIITVNAEKKVPVAHDTKPETQPSPVHISHAVNDPISQPAYPFSPQFYSPYPYAHHISHPAVASDFHIRTVSPAPAPVPVPLVPPPSAVLPSFIYHDHPIQPVSPIFIQQPSHQAHHYLPGNYQDILAAKHANVLENRPSIQEIENMVRHASDEAAYNDKNVQQESFQIRPKPMMFQLADPPVHLLVPGNNFDPNYKNYLAPSYPYQPYYYQPTNDIHGKSGLSPQYVGQIDPEYQKSVLTNFFKPIYNHLPAQFRPGSTSSSTAAPTNIEQQVVSSTSTPEVQADVNKGQTVTPSSASPSPYFNIPFLYPLTTFLQRPFFQHHSSQASQVQQEQQDSQRVQKPMNQAQQASIPVEQQQRYYVIQPQPNGQYRFNPAPSNPVNQPKPAALKTNQPVRAAPVPQTHVPTPSEKSGLYSFPYNSPVALLVLPMNSDYSNDKQNIKPIENKAKNFDHYYK